MVIKNRKIVENKALALTGHSMYLGNSYINVDGRSGCARQVYSGGE